MSMENRETPRSNVTVFANQEFGQQMAKLSMSLDMSSYGISLISTRAGDSPEAKHAWIRFYLPGSDRLISALGEVIHRSCSEEFEVTGYRFKYLFPDHRRLLESYLEVRH